MMLILAPKHRKCTENKICSLLIILLLFQLMYKGQPIVKVACGGDFSMILDCKGTLHSFGHPEYSQLGKYNPVAFLRTVGPVDWPLVLSDRQVPQRAVPVARLVNSA